MTALSFSSLFLALLAADHPLAVRDSQLCLPPITDRTWDLYTSKRVSPNTTINSPNWPQLRGKRSFSGRFTLTVIQWWPPTADSIRRGNLEIGSLTRGRQTGTSDIDFQAWGISGAAYSAGSRDSMQPGVVVDSDEQGRVLLTVAGANMEDAGILFAVFRVDSLGFVGMWTSGAAVSQAPRGYFCASRQG